MLRVHAVFVRADVVSEHTSSTAAKSVADGVPKRPGAAQVRDALTTLAKNSKYRFNKNLKRGFLSLYPGRGAFHAEHSA